MYQYSKENESIVSYMKLGSIMGREGVNGAVMLGALWGIYVINASPGPYEVLLCWSPLILSFQI